MSSQYLQLMVVFLIILPGIIYLIWVLYKRALKTAIEKLNIQLEANLVKEEELNGELKRAKEESQAQIQQGKIQAEAIIEEANKEAARLRLNIQEQAKSEADKIVADGRLEAEKFKLTLVKDIQAQSIAIALKMIAQLLTETEKIALQYEFANGIIEEISQLSKDQFNIIDNHVKVVSSFPLLQRQRDQIKRVLAQKIGKEIQLNEQIDPGIIGGLTLEMGGMIIDGTLKNKLQRIIPHLK